MATIAQQIVVNFLGNTAGLDKSVTHVNRMLSGVGRASMAAGAATSAVFGGLAGSALLAAANLEQTTIAFRTLTGSMEVANKLMKDMEQFSAKTPFELSEVEQAGKKLLAMGFNAEQIIPTLHDVGNVTAGIGIAGGRFDRIVHNLAQVATQGHLTSREFRDFAVNGVPLMEALTHTMEGVPEGAKAGREAIDAMIQKGQISAEDVRRAFRYMATEGRFKNLMFEQSKTLLGIVSNIKDKVVITLRGIGKAFVEPAKAMLRPFVRFLDMISEASDETKQMIGYVALFGTGLGLLATAAGAAMLPLAGFALLIPTFVWLWSIIGPFAGALALIAAKGALAVAVISQAALGMSGYEASFAGIKQLIVDMLPKVKDLIKGTIGFFANFKHNAGVIFRFIKDNIFNFLLVIPKLFLDVFMMSIEFMVINFKHGINSIFKLTGFLVQSIGNMFVYLWRWIFGGGMLNSLVKGLGKAYDILVDFYLRLFEGVRSGKFDPFGSFLAGQHLANEKGFLAGLNELRKEFFLGLKAPEFNFDYLDTSALDDLKTSFDDAAKAADDFKVPFDEIGDGADEAGDAIKDLMGDITDLRNMFANRDDFDITQEGLVFGIFDEAKKAKETVGKERRYAMAGPDTPMTGFDQLANYKGRTHSTIKRAGAYSTMGQSLDYMTNIQNRDIGMPGQGPLIEAPTPTPVTLPTDETISTNSPSTDSKLDAIFNLMQTNSHTTSLRTLGEGGDDFPL